MHRVIRTILLVLPGTLLLAAFGQAAPAAGHPVVPGFERFHTSGKNSPAPGGRLLLGELGCVNCHQTGDASLTRRQGPVLDRVGERVKARYLERYLADPRAAKPGTTMPHVLADDPDREQKAKALAHFLASTGAVAHERPQTKNVGLGRDLYSRVGCAACHGSRDARGEADKVLPTSVPLGDLKAKYTIPGLTKFLADPLHVRAGGRMPRLLQNEKEAKEVATYLLQGIKAPLVGKGTTRYAYYEGSWNDLPDFSKLKPTATGVAAGFDVNVARRDSNYALKFDGVLDVPRGGNYTFTLTSDDGSKLYVGGTLVVDNGGIHAPQTRTGKAVLTRGVHKITVEFFQGGGGAELSAEIMGPGIGQRPIGDMVAASEAELKKKPAVKTPSEDTFEIRPELVEKGRALFASHGCASCHQLKQGGKTVGEPLKATPVEKLTAGRGCLADKPARGIPWYGLSGTQRKALAAGTTAKAPARGAAAVIAEAMTAFNCYACHVRDKVGGPQEELNKLFQTTQPEMGDEARLPPPLDGVGAKLNPEYLRLLLDRGVHDRPYMHTRMPGFGDANVGHLVEVFGNTDRVPAAPKVTFKESPAKVKAEARHLTGALALGCIKCHTFAGKKAEGVQGMDMAILTKRLRRDWFHHYVMDPQKVRPGTRMPTAFPDGQSSLPKILDGKASTQIEAMWVYLLDGTKARLPVGASQNSIPLVPVASPILYRNFIAGAGTRAIAVGYPEKAHLAFDANELRLAMIWQGAFIDAGRHWNGRGEGFEGPMGDNVLNLPAGAAFATLDRADTPWPKEAPRSLGFRFRGYRLNAEEKPTFLYDLNGIHFEDYLTPVTTTKDPSFRRTITLSSTKPLNNLHYRAAVADRIEAQGEGWFRIDGTWKMRLQGGAKPEIRKSGGKTELLVPVRFRDGKAQLVQDYVW